MDVVVLQIVMSLLFIAVGFCCGLMAEAEFHDNKKVDRLERKIRRLEKRLEGCK